VTCSVLGNRPLPNKRLKLPGGDRFKGTGVLCPGGRGLSVCDGCARARVARSLSAIRQAATADISRTPSMSFPSHLNPS